MFWHLVPAVSHSEMFSSISLFLQLCVDVVNVTDTDGQFMNSYEIVETFYEF